MAFSADVSVALKTIPAALRKLQPKGAAERFKLVFLLNVPKRRQIDGRRRHPLAPIICLLWYCGLDRRKPR